MSALWLAVVLAAAPRVEAIPLVVTAEGERVALSYTGARAEVEALGARVFLPGAPAAVALAFAKSAICPAAVVVEGGVELRCTTRRITARVQGGALELRRTLGIPLTNGDDAAPRIFYAPDEVFLGAPCDEARAPSERAECALARGDEAAAKRELSTVVDAAHASHASLRLGDLALWRGAVDEAAAHYESAGRVGPWGRLAMLRLCELKDTCFERGLYARGYLPVDHAALPEPMAREVLLRRARAHAFRDELAEALRLLVDEGMRSDGSHLCRDALSLCRRILSEALRANAGEPLDAVALFSTLPARDEAPLELVRLVAEAAASAGAAHYAASLLASVSARVARRDLADHLRRTAALYVAARDDERARIVAEYAVAAFGGDVAAWLPSRSDGAASEIALELEGARALLERARVSSVKAPTPRVE